VRIGFFCAPAAPTQGGSYAFSESLRGALLGPHALEGHDAVFYGVGGRGRLRRFDPSEDGDPQSFLRDVTRGSHAGARAIALLGRSWRWQRALQRDHIQLVWSDGPDAPLTGVPHVATIWDMGHRLMPFFPEVGGPRPWRVREGRLKQVARRAAAIIVGTRTGRAQVRRFYGVAPERIHILPFSVPGPLAAAEPPDTVRPALPFSGPFLLYPAQYWPHKNHVVLLRALRVLAARGLSSVHLVCTGSDRGALEHIRTLMATYGVSDRVHHLGFVARSELLALYGSATALVFPSFLGPDNLPPLEAFSIGCPVVASAVPGAVEQLGAGARLVPPADAEHWADAIQEVLTGSDAVTQRVHAGRAIAQHRSVSAYIQGIKRVIDEFEPYRACWPV
jgi:glycosyltransferase involved in cell wall biosynthesis